MFSHASASANAINTRPIRTAAAPSKNGVLVSWVGASPARAITRPLIVTTPSVSAVSVASWLVFLNASRNPLQPYSPISVFVPL